MDNEIEDIIHGLDKATDILLDISRKGVHALPPEQGKDLHDLTTELCVLLFEIERTVSLPDKNGTKKE